MISFKEEDKCFTIILKSILLLITYAGAGFLALLLVYSLPRDLILLNNNNIEGSEITIISGMVKVFSHYLQLPYLLLIMGGLLYTIILSLKTKPVSTWLCRSIPWSW